MTQIFPIEQYLLQPKIWTVIIERISLPEVGGIRTQEKPEENGKDIFWFESPQSPFKQWKRHIVASEISGGFSMDVADMDQDGDSDIILGKHKGKPNQIIIFENEGKGYIWIPHLVDSGDKNIDHHDGTQVVDIDNDGDPDIISIGWYHPKVWIFENRALKF